jgi:hypothetical protein
METRAMLEDETYTSPFVTEAEAVGLYDADLAAITGRQTACDPGSGPTRIDD